MSVDLGERIRSIRHVASLSLRKIWKTTSLKLQDEEMGRGKYMVFRGSMKNFVENGAMALEESITLFHGRTNPIRNFSVDELNAMNLEPHSMSYKESDVKWYKGYWNGSYVLVKEQSEKAYSELRSATFREILVAAQMSTHKNVHKLLGCCLETKYAVLVYEWVENVTLYDLLFRDKRPGRPLDWKKRLMIAWEISHALAYLHTGFHRPIIHRSLKPQNVYMGEDNAAKLSDFSFSISVPEGKKFVDENLIVGTFGYLAPEYGYFSRVAVSIDVYAFGVFFLILLTGKDAVSTPVGETEDEATHIRDWVMKGLEYKCITEIVDPEFTGHRSAIDEELKKQLRASVGLALKCAAIMEYSRPTMVEVATELKSMIEASESVPASNTL